MTTSINYPLYIYIKLYVSTNLDTYMYTHTYTFTYVSWSGRECKPTILFYLFILL